MSSFAPMIDSTAHNIVLITGANQGLGFEVVKKLAAENEHYKIIIGARSPAKGRKAAAEVTSLAAGTAVDVLEIDVTSDESVEKAAKVVQEKYGRLDVLFNNAGIGYSQRKTKREQLHEIFDVNVAGVLVVTEAFVPLLKQSKAPRIVIMTSDLGSLAYTMDEKHYAHFYQEPIYKSSKAAVNMMGAVFSNIYKDAGISVNLVNPGFRATAFNDHSEHAGDKEGGAVEPCRVITLNQGWQGVTYTEDGASLPW